MRSTYAKASWIFLRLLGCVYLFAFWSLAQQTQGLIGHDGILPAAGFMNDVRGWTDTTGIGIDRFRLIPTVFWFSTSDGFLQTVTTGGALLSALLILGLGQVAVLAILWILYLSVNVVSGEFLSYQWDALLLEAGLLAVFLAPLRWHQPPRAAEDPPRLARWLIWWLLFRLMFGSGLVKLASGDPAWRDLTALSVHYESQPLPTPLAWYASQLPLWFHQATTFLVLVVELVVPWFIFMGRRMRTMAAILLIGLQFAIAVTGNYGFFNLLTIVLCVTLLDDQTLRRAKTSGAATDPGPVTDGRATRWAPVVAAIVLGPVSVATLASQLGFGIPFIAPLAGAIDPFRSVNPYGLFAVMTTARMEIQIEGSVDGRTWREYDFFDKPGAVTRPPPWVAPFQPRLDWQMWFAALSRYEQERWFRSFCARLLAGSPPVKRLLAGHPFNGTPPRFLRATMYRYRFTDMATRRATGAWWTRERVREYSPVMSLDANRPE